MGFFLFIVAHYIVPTYYCDFPTLTTLPLISEKPQEQVGGIGNDDYNTYMASDLRSISKGMSFHKVT